MKRTISILFITFAVFAVLAITGCDSSSDGGTTSQGGGLDSIPALGDMTIYDGDTDSTMPV